MKSQQSGPHTWNDKRESPAIREIVLQMAELMTSENILTAIDPIGGVCSICRSICAVVEVICGFTHCGNVAGKR